MSLNAQQYLEEKRKAVDHFLENLFRTNDKADRLKEAIRYSLLGGGKRVRPILTIAAAEACGWGEEGEKLALPVGAALELIHTYSLIHDDLPAMDNDDLRRGRPTSHKVYGEAVAILAGDSLLSESFALIASLPTRHPEVLLKVIWEIAQASGADGMAGGQAIDLEVQGKKVSASELEHLHRKKTGCLIQAAVASGALVGGGDAQRLQAVREYGAAAGLAFQIADDILNVEGETRVLGKTAGSDALQRKATYPTVLGMEASKKLARDLTEKAVGMLKDFGPAADPLRAIARFIISRRS